MSSILESLNQTLKYFYGLWRNGVELDARKIGVLWIYEHDPKEEPVNRAQAPKVMRSSQGMPMIAETSSFIILGMVEEFTLKSR